MSQKKQVIDPTAIQVVQILKEGRYKLNREAWVSIEKEQAFAEVNTKLYTPEKLEILRQKKGTERNNLVVEVVEATTQQWHSLERDPSVVLLNFASARNPGGGFLGGAKAQEEDLCRCSGLFCTLLTQPIYYNANREQPSLLYTDNLIYSPKVLFFRLSEHSSFLEKPFLASVISAPASNAGELLEREPSAKANLSLTFERRWTNVLAVAEENGHKVLVLGAWGCGAFRNDPILAETAQKVLRSERFAQAFERVIFAIPNRGNRGQANFAAFREVFG